jgi:hypothetical protein
VLCADNFFTGARRNVEHLLGWTSRTPLRQGLAKTIAYFEQLFAGSTVNSTALDVTTGR